MKAYIKSTSAISAQQTFDKSSYLKRIEAFDNVLLKANEPAYREIIDPKLLRRMSRIIKMSIACSNQVLAEAKVDTPEAIIVGTGLGCIQDTVKFLKDIITSEEGVLSPTAFIQSTHNTVAGQIALLLQCPYYNFTYSNRGHSFENGIIDARMQLADGNDNILVGAADEMTEDVHDILSQMDCKGQRSAIGEGAAFFVLTTQAEQGRPYLQDIYTTNNISNTELEIALYTFLNKNQISVNDIDVLMLGNAEGTSDKYYEQVKSILTDTPTLSYKKICGEYFTSSSFAMHLATMILQHPQTVEKILLDLQINKPVKTVLIYNHYNAMNHSFMLLSV